MSAGGALTGPGLGKQAAVQVLPGTIPPDEVSPVDAACSGGARSMGFIRVKVKPLRDISEPVPFKPLVPALSFIKNKVM